MTIKYPDSDCKFLEANATMIEGEEEGKDWYYFPFWMHKVGEGVFEQVSWDNLPQYLKEEILFQQQSVEDIKNISQQGEQC